MNTLLDLEREVTVCPNSDCHQVAEMISSPHGRSAIRCAAGHRFIDVDTEALKAIIALKNLAVGQKTVMVDYLQDLIRRG